MVIFHRHPRDVKKAVEYRCSERIDNEQLEASIFFYFRRATKVIKMTMPAAIAGAMGARGGLMYNRGPTIDDYKDDNNLRSFCIAFRPDNKIHVFPPSRQTAQLLKVTVEAYWGIDSEEVATNCYTLNLEGAPFLMYSRRENALQIKYICCLILEQFRIHGWELVVCTDLSSKTDLTAWYFERVPMDAHGRPLLAVPEGNTSLVCLSLSAKRKLQLINASAPLQTILRNVVIANYEPGLDQVSGKKR